MWFYSFNSISIILSLYLFILSSYYIVHNKIIDFKHCTWISSVLMPAAEEVVCSSLCSSLGSVLSTAGKQQTHIYIQSSGREQTHIYIQSSGREQTHIYIQSSEKCFHLKGLRAQYVQYVFCVNPLSPGVTFAWFSL